MSELPNPKCDVCGKRVNPPGDIIWMDLSVLKESAKARKEWTAKHRDEDGGLSVDMGQLFEMPRRARWRISHSDCITDTSNEYYLQLPASYKELVSHTAHLLGKAWIPDTDLEKFLFEAAQQRDRWAPAIS